MSQVWKDYQEKNKVRFLEEMLDLLRIPSVSAKSEHKSDMLKCAEAVKKSLLAAGCEKAEVIPTPGHPVVYGEKIIDPSKPTVLIYGHYDVQPAEPLELWHSGPFDPVIKDGKVKYEKYDDKSLPEDGAVLDTEITAQLKEEGIVREFTRSIQDLRKENGLTPKDRIVLSLDVNNTAQEVLEKYLSEIKSVVQADEVRFESNDGQSVNIEGLDIKVKFV